MASAAASSDMKAVAAALDGGSETTASLHQMLCAGLPHAVGAGSERHAYQNEHLSMTQEAVEAAQKDAEETAVGTKRKLDDAHGELSAREARVPDVESTIKAAEEVAKNKEKVLATKREEVASVKKLKTAADHDLASQKKTAGALQKTSDQIAQVMELLGVLREGGWADDDVRDTSASEVNKLLQLLDVEDVLLTAAPHALKKSPAERGPFDAVVLKGVSDAVLAKNEKAKTEASEANTTMEEAQWEAMGLHALLEVSQESRDDADREHRDAVSSVKQANGELKRARGEVDRQREAITALEGEIKAAEVLAGSHKEALEALQRLREWSYASAAAAEEEAASKVADAAPAAESSGSAAACGA